MCWHWYFLNDYWSCRNAEKISRVLERKLWPTAKPQIQEEPCGFQPGCSLTLHSCWGQPSNLLVPHGVLWGVLHVYGLLLPLLRALWPLYNQSENCKCILCSGFSVGVLCQSCTRSLILFVVFMGKISKSRVRRVYSLGTSDSGMHRGVLQPGWESATPHLRPWSSVGTRWICYHQRGSQLLPEAKGVKVCWDLAHRFWSE